MLRTVIAVVAGAVLGVALGATVIAPGLAPAPLAPAHTAPEAPKRIMPVPDDKAGTSVRWTLTSAFPANRPHLGDLVRQIDRALVRLSGGTFELRLAEQGNSSPDLYTAVAAGARDAVFASPAQWHVRVPALQLFAGHPFGPDTDTFLAWFHAGGGRQLYETLHNRQGVHGLLCGMTVSGVSGWFTTPITMTDDFKGLRIRASGLGAEVLARVGAETLSIPETEVLGAFEDGALDAAVLSSLPSIDSRLSMESQARHYYFPGWYQSAAFYELIVNLRQWKSLSTADRTRLETVCGDNILRGMAETEAAQFGALKDLQTRGVDIRRLPEEVLEQLSSVWRELAGEKAGTDSDFDRVWSSLSNYSEEHAIWRELSQP